MIGDSKVRAIDPSAEAYPGSAGRSGCAPHEVLFIGST